ncbi:MAG: aminotransferase class V-fold PLP-dependent enzyme [Candidatus Shikimatogenerans sp. JK-2022]|nr:aminotransferase class V-fold PLP-dependent enzyme [Candidatus Shikimatogenerans bostrichidophilus]
MFTKKEIKKIRKNFPIFKKKINGKKLIYFDNASTTQKPKCLIEKIKYYYFNLNSNINRNNCFLSNKTRNLINLTRKKIKEFINAKSLKEIIFTKGATESINLISKTLNIKKKDEIIITEIEHNSNIFPWLLLKKEKKNILKIIKLNNNYNITLKKVIKNINKKTKLISLTHISNSLGIILPIKYLIKKIKKKNKKILILLDGAQSISHIPINVQELNIDFYVFSTHKIYGPTGLGILYGKKKELKKLNFYQVGGSGGFLNKIKEINKYNNFLPNKFEFGTPNICSIISFYYVIKFLEKIKIKNINLYEKKLIEYTKKKFEKNKNIEIYGNNQQSILSFNIKNLNNLDIELFLNKYGICVRSGFHCNSEFFKKKIKKGTLRISYGLYNTYKEIDFFYKILLKIIKYLN